MFFLPLILKCLTYIEWGEDVSQKLNEDFAFVILIKKKNIIFFQET